MTTARTYRLVSLAAMAVTLVLGACAGTPPRVAPDGVTTIEEGRSLTIRFDNDAREHVHVYLIGYRREWLLGRVEPGAIRTLRIPEASLADGSRHMQLAVIPGERMTHLAARNPRATLTIAQPVSAMLSREWKFAQGQLSPVAPR